MFTGSNRFGLLKENLLPEIPYREDNWTKYYKDGSDAINQFVDDLYQNQNLVTYFIPQLPVSVLYNDFSLESYEDQARIILNRTLNLPERSTQELQGRRLEYSVKYNPDEYPPSQGYYIQTTLTSLTEPDIYNGGGFYTTILYGMYTWFNNFNWDSNSWSRNIGLFIDQSGKWLLHPGRARLSYPQFAGTNTPVIAVVHRDIDLKEYIDNSIRINYNIEEIQKIICTVSGYSDADINFRIHDSIVDAWYTERHNGRSYTGETFTTYFGDHLSVEFRNNVLTYNDEPVVYLKDDKLYFYNTAPRFNLEKAIK